jgi:hypothetical protein
MMLATAAPRAGMNPRLWRREQSWPIFCDEPVARDDKSRGSDWNGYDWQFVHRHGDKVQVAMRFKSKPFDWVAALALVSGAVVVVPSVIAVAMAVAGVVMALI